MIKELLPFLAILALAGFIGQGIAFYFISSKDHAIRLRARVCFVVSWGIVFAYLGIVVLMK